MNYLLMLAGTVLLVIGAELLVRGASRLAFLIKISPLVVGLTVVAFGTGAPELAVSVASALKGDAAIAVGNVVGSNIFNVLLILGLSAIVIPLSVARQVVRFDMPLVIFVSLMLWAIASDGSISRSEGVILAIGLIVYTVWSVRQSRKESTTVQEEYAHEFPPLSDTDTRIRSVAYLVLQICLVIVGLAVLIAGSRLLVTGAVGLATALGVSSAVIGLTIVAFGTSLPEVATSLIAAWKGEKDIAIGNVVGSNLFNILGVLGISAIVAPNGLSVTSSFLQFDIPIMVLVAILCYSMLIRGREIARWEGAVFLICYVLYLVVTVFVETNHRWAPDPVKIMWYVALPFTAAFALFGVVHQPKSHTLPEVTSEKDAHSS